MSAAASYDRADALTRELLGLVAELQEIDPERLKLTLSFERGQPRRAATQKGAGVPDSRLGRVAREIGDLPAAVNDAPPGTDQWAILAATVRLERELQRFQEILKAGER